MTAENVQVVAYVNYPDDGLVTYEFRGVDVAINIVEHLGDKGGSDWVSLNNTEEYEPAKLRQLVQIYGHESEVIEAMRDEVEQIVDTCEDCEGVYKPYDSGHYHNCSSRWVDKEWEREADSMMTSVSVLRAIADVTATAFGCTNAGDKSAADKEWEEGEKAQQVLARVWEIEDGDVVFWGLEQHVRGQ